MDPMSTESFVRKLDSRIPRICLVCLLWAVSILMAFLSETPLVALPTFRVIALSVVGVLGGIILPIKSLGKMNRALLGCLILAFLYWSGLQLMRVTNQPFSLAWSEGNHLWDASLIYIRGSYLWQGEAIVPNYVTPGLYGLRGLPFIFEKPLLIHLRLWEATLWILPGLALGWAMTLIWKWRDLPWQIGFAIWASLFLAQGPVYAPLLLACMIAIFSVRVEKGRYIFLLVLIATFVAGISRWTWIVAPPAVALIAILLRWDLDSGHLEQNHPFPRSFLVWILGAGISGAALALLANSLITGRQGFAYLASLRQPLLWYRLLPNATYEPGILAGLLIFAGPVTLALVLWLWREIQRLSWQVLFLVGMIMFGLLGIGLVVSVKIGGGSNLHNLDMFLVAIIVIASVAVGVSSTFRDRFFPTKTLAERALLIGVVLLPVLWVFSRNPFRLPWTADIAETSLEQLTDMVRERAAEGDVLFIDQRQLFTFGYLEDIPLVAEYELIELMDHAMAADEPYLQKFSWELGEKRFSAIVVDPLTIVWKGSQASFGEENDAWVQYVTIPILAEYEPVLQLDDVGVWVLIPRSD